MLRVLRQEKKKLMVSRRTLRSRSGTNSKVQPAPKDGREGHKVKQYGKTTKVSKHTDDSKRGHILSVQPSRCLLSLPHILISVEVLCLIEIVQLQHQVFLGKLYSSRTSVFYSFSFYTTF